MPRIFSHPAFWVFVVTLVIATILPLFPNPYIRLVAWAVVAVGVVAVISAVTPDTGLGIRAHIIDVSNLYEASKVITLTWFTMIVSAYLACALWNVQLWDGADPELAIAIDVPPTVWALAGIVVVGLVGASVILWQKGLRKAEDRHVEAARKSDPSTPPNCPLFVREGPAEARASDLITYDEWGVQNKTDMAALQQLLFQIAAVIIYAVALGRLILITPASTPILTFPDIPEGFVALLGVVTLGALANRAIAR